MGNSASRQVAKKASEAVSRAARVASPSATPSKSIPLQPDSPPTGSPSLDPSIPQFIKDEFQKDQQVIRHFGQLDFNVKTANAPPPKKVCGLLRCSTFGQLVQTGLTLVLFVSAKDLSHRHIITWYRIMTFWIF